MKKLLKNLSYIAIALLVVSTVAYAADKLTPPGGASNTMYSLTDIWNLATGTTTTEGTGTIESTPGTLSETGKTLTEVYTALSTEIAKLSPTVLTSGTTAFGITGTASSGPAPLTWQTDPALNLCWSHNQYEIDSGCTVGSGFIKTPDNLSTLGAVEYCKYLNADGTTLANTEQNIWHLPTIQEYQSITDFTIFNNATQVPGFAQSSYYWSGTQHAEDTYNAWLWNTYFGKIGSNGKYNQYPVRCAH